jgi:hypothetical protein
LPVNFYLLELLCEWAERKKVRRNFFSHRLSHVLSFSALGFPRLLTFCGWEKRKKNTSEGKCLHERRLLTLLVGGVGWNQVRTFQKLFDDAKADMLTSSTGSLFIFGIPVPFFDQDPSNELRLDWIEFNYPQQWQMRSRSWEDCRLDFSKLISRFFLDFSLEANSEKRNENRCVSIVGGHSVHSRWRWRRWPDVPAKSPQQ